MEHPAPRDHRGPARRWRRAIPGQFLALAGGELAFDHARDPETGDISSFRAGGAFAEGQYAILPSLVGFLRFDYFDPSASVGQNEILAGTVGAFLYEEWISVIPEIQVRSTNAPDRRTTDARFVVSLRAVY